MTGYDALSRNQRYSRLYLEMYHYLILRLCYSADVDKINHTEYLKNPGFDKFSHKNGNEN